MFQSLILSCLALLSFANASLFDSLDNQTVGNADDACAVLDSLALCSKAGPCVWSGAACSKDPCFVRTVTAGGSCPTITSGTCSNVLKAGTTEKSHFCVNSNRLSSFDTKQKICSLEWGSSKFVELAACKMLTGDAYGCGGVEEIEGKGYYVCKEGTPPVDPCNTFADREKCTYVGECMYDGINCVTDLCWEKTYLNADGCKSNINGVTCLKHVLNGDLTNYGTPQIGYCKTTGHDLHSKCNVGTATNFVTKAAVCLWSATEIPADCVNVATIKNYDDGTLYVCNPTDEEFNAAGASSLNSFVAGMSVLILLFLMM